MEKKQHYQLQERALRLAYNEYDLSINKMFEKDRSYTVHHYNIHALAIEMFVVYKNLSETISIDSQENTYNFRRNKEFQISGINTYWNGSNLTGFYGTIIWDLVTSWLKYTSPQLTFTRSQSTIETVEKGVKYVQS